MSFGERIKPVQAFLGGTKFTAAEESAGAPPRICITRTSANGKVTLFYVPKDLFDAYAIEASLRAFEALLQEKLR